MKYSNYILAFVFIIFLSACEDKDPKPILDNENATAPTLLTPANASSYIFLAENATDSFEEITWTPADYGTNLAKKYTVIVENNATPDAQPTTLIETTELSYTATMAELNLILFDLGFTNATSSAVNFSVSCSSTHEAVEPLKSAKNNVTITPFTYKQPNLAIPADGSSFVLEKDTTGTVEFDEFSWAEVNYYLETSAKYSLEFDAPGNNFANSSTIYSGEETSHTPKVLDLNNALLDHGFEAELSANVEFRITSSTDGKGEINSEVFVYNIKPFSFDNTEEPYKETLYLVGNATTAGWDAAAGLPIEWDEDRQVHSITTTLIAGGMKILMELGKWAPQWGDDGNGDGTGGLLIFRPDEETADPAEIPSPGEGTYKIDVDLINLTYSINPE